MALSDGLTDRLARYDRALVSADPALADDLIASGVEWLQTQTGWFLGKAEVRTLYFAGGGFSIYLPQPGTITEVAIRYSGATWTVLDTDQYALIGDDSRELIRSTGGPWFGSPPTMNRTPGTLHASTGRMYGLPAPGTRTVRVRITVGFDTADDWPQDLMDVLMKLAAAGYRLRTLARGRSPIPDEETIQSAMTPTEWKTIKDYAKKGKVMAA